ncbi:hypothetical protein [Sphingomonas sp.]|jgi:hypothetical protein|uniref:hypothetical protein n=1 Tax=Sphingomonas sp. TaxID=28214 RepID=UPI002E2FE52E|nr:hypothetical protein [Sphingomonas sp.]HEX4695024.1 hypothetical protein [Sphingomonas sp.]
MAGEETMWWQRRWVALTAIVIATVPLLYPAIPPLTDVPGHIGGYRILAEAGRGPLAQHYAVHWAMIGNLGIEGLVLALHPLLDVEPATHLIVALIPALTVAAMLWLAREAHGRMPAAAGFALPLAYALPFQLGFVNFALAAALAMAGLALWIRLARTRAGWVRVVVLAGIAGPVWLCHSFGWAMLGLFVLGAEWVIRGRRGERGWGRLGLTALACVPMAWPQLLAMAEGTPMSGDTGDWFHLSIKAQWIVSLLQERWKIYDVTCVVALAALLWTAIRSRRMRFEPLLGVPALFGLIAFVVTPRLFAGGAYVDMRMLPYTVALAALAIRADEDVVRPLAAFGAAFFLLRLGTSTIAFALIAQGQAKELAAVAYIPPGAAVLALVDEPSTAKWVNPRLGHIAGIAVARSRAFTNEQWAISGQQLIAPRHPAAAPLDRDPSQLVPQDDPRAEKRYFDAAIAGFDRATFNYVWTVGFPAGRARARDLTLIWSNAHSALYRVDRVAALSPVATAR